MSKPTLYERVICAIGALHLVGHDRTTKEEMHDYLTLGFEALESLLAPVPASKGDKSVGKTCANCLHWHPDRLARCRGWGQCLRTGSMDDKPERPPTTATALAQREGFAWLETAPTHSCSMWEAKE